MVVRTKARKPGEEMVDSKRDSGTGHLKKWMGKKRGKASSACQHALVAQESREQRLLTALTAEED